MSQLQDALKLSPSGKALKVWANRDGQWMARRTLDGIQLLAFPLSDSGYVGTRPAPIFASEEGVFAAGQARDTSIAEAAWIAYPD